MSNEQLSPDQLCNYCRLPAGENMPLRYSNDMPPQHEYIGYCAYLLREQLTQAQEALKFYADDESYKSALKFRGCGCRADWDKTPVLVDDGALAKAIIRQRQEQSK